MMGTKTGISWTEATWNPIRGCSRVSDGCRLCYAEVVAARFSGPGQPYEGLAHHVTPQSGPNKGIEEARWTGDIRPVPKHLNDPLRWQTPRLIFVNSMSDLFHPGLPRSELDKIVAVMGLAGRHIFQPLTKRHEEMRDYLNDPRLVGRLMDAAEALKPSSLWNGSVYQMRHELETNGFLPNVWWGVSCEDQLNANARVPALLGSRAAVRWVSYEPALGPIAFRRIELKEAERWVDSLTGWGEHDSGDTWRGPSLDWIVVGGESNQGPKKAHPFAIEWAERVRRDCDAAGVAYYFKQLGSTPTRGGVPWPISDRMGKDHGDWPDSIDPQDYPPQAAKLQPVAE